MTRRPRRSPAADRPGRERSLDVVIINDRYENWAGHVGLRIVGADGESSAQVRPCTVDALGRETVSFDIELPREPGSYTRMAELRDDAGLRVQSRRDVRITTKED